MKLMLRSHEPRKFAESGARLLRPLEENAEKRRSRAGPANLPEIPDVKEEPEWNLLCPECGGAAFVAGAYLHCPAEGRRFPTLDGILPLLTGERWRDLVPFLAAYRMVRRAEGWGGDSQYYLDLPFHDRSGRHRGIWKLRARSFRVALTEVKRVFGTLPLQVLDLGAGNCWLAARLARLGHRVLAVDVQLDDRDGLRAFNRYHLGLAEASARVHRAQADLERLALGARQFDLVVANGSLHYAADRFRAASEACRVLRPDGLLLVLDSPTYSSADFGAAMVADRQRDHRDRYGLSLGPRLQSGFLVYSDFVGMLERLGFAVRVVRSFAGWSREFRGLLARTRKTTRRRPPAEFPVFVARKAAQGEKAVGR